MKGFGESQCSASIVGNLALGLCDLDRSLISMGRVINPNLEKGLSQIVNRIVGAKFGGQLVFLFL